MSRIFAKNTLINWDFGVEWDGESSLPNRSFSPCPDWDFASLHCKDSCSSIFSQIRYSFCTGYVEVQEINIIGTSAFLHNSNDDNVTCSGSRILYPWIKQLHFFLTCNFRTKKMLGMLRNRQLLSPFRHSVAKHRLYSMALFCTVYATQALSQNILLTWIILASRQDVRSENL